MITGVDLFERRNRHVLAGNRGLDTHHYSGKPVPQPGWDQTSAGMHHFVLTEHTMGTPPSELGRVPDYDRQFAERVGDTFQPHPGFTQKDPRGPWNPLWMTDYMRNGQKQDQYEWDFLTPHGAVEDVLLYRSQLSRAPFGHPYTVPTEHPAPVQPVQVGAPLLW